MARMLVGIFISLATTQAAFAEATSQGAHEIESNYAAYFGDKAVDEGVVTVEPDGDAYVVTWHLQKALDLAGVAAGAVTIGPFSYRLTPAANDAWTLKSDSFPHIAFDVPNDKKRVSGAFDLKGFALDAQYDPAQEPFLASKLSVQALISDFDVADGDQHSRAHVEEQNFTAESNVKTSADGGVDFALAQSLTGLRETVAAPNADQGGEIQMSYDASGAMGDATASGFKASEIADLWKSLVENTGDKDDATKQELKKLLVAALPLWKTLGGSVTLNDLNVQTPFGNVAFKTLGEKLAFSGFTEQGEVKFGLGLTEVTVKSPLVPAWAEQLWPLSLDITLRGNVDGLDKVARLALDDPQFGGGDLSSDTQQAIQTTLLHGNPKLVVEPGRLKTPTIDVTYEGEATFADGAPAGHVTLTADSLDKVLALLEDLAKVDPDARNGALVVTMVKGMAKTGTDGRLVWEIVSNGNDVTVNGQPLPGK